MLVTGLDIEVLSGMVTLPSARYVSWCRLALLVLVSTKVIMFFVMNQIRQRATCCIMPRWELEFCTNADRKRDKRMDRHVDRQMDTHTHTQCDDGQTENRQTRRQTNRWMDTHIDRQTYRRGNGHTSIRTNTHFNAWTHEHF